MAWRREAWTRILARAPPWAQPCAPWLTKARCVGVGPGFALLGQDLLAAGRSSARAQPEVVHGIAENDDNMFSIDASTGQLTLTGPADYETRDLYAVRVSATSGDYTIYCAVSVLIGPVNEVVVILNPDATFEIEEKALPETRVTGTGESSGEIGMSASDPDGGQSLVYKIIAGNTQPDGKGGELNGMFKIGSCSGEIAATAQVRG